MNQHLSGMIYLLLILMSVDSLNAQTTSPGIDMNDPEAILVVARALNGLDTTVRALRTQKVQIALLVAQG